MEETIFGLVMIALMIAALLTPVALVIYIIRATRRREREQQVEAAKRRHPSYTGED